MLNYFIWRIFTHVNGSPIKNTGRQITGDILFSNPCPLFPPTVMYFYLQMRGVSLADGNIVCWSTWFQWSSLTPRHGTIPMLSCLNFTLLYTRTSTFYNSKMLMTVLYKFKFNLELNLSDHLISWICLLVFRLLDCICTIELLWEANSFVRYIMI